MNPSIVWPDNRKRVLLGRLEIKRLTANTAKVDRALAFNPHNVTGGIQTADLLSSLIRTHSDYRRTKKNEMSSPLRESEESKTSPYAIGPTVSRLEFNEIVT